MELKLKSISKKYGSVKALNSVSITMTPGVWGLLGANGAGKTTLMKVICMLIRQDAGDLRWNDAPATRIQKKYLSQIAYLPQHFGADNEFTVKDYMHYMAGLKGFTKKQAGEAIERLLSETSLADQKKMKMKNLSGGMRRRLGIAQALVNNPDLLVLDEPTVGLDPKERVRFREILSEYTNNKIVLLSTHIVSDLESLANQIVIMHKGRIIATGSPEQLCNKVQGKVWECPLPREARNELGNICVANIKNIDPLTLMLRYIAEKPINGHSEQRVPTLEDAYMWNIENDTGGREMP